MQLGQLEIILRVLPRFMHISKSFLYISLSFIGGVFLSSFLFFPQFLIWELFGIGIASLLIFRKDKVIVVFALCVIFLGLGVCRVQLAGAPGDKEASFSEEENIILEEIQPVREKFLERIYENFSPPQSSFLAALTLGFKNKISEKWKDKLNGAGVRHLVVISGMHIITLIVLLFWLSVVVGLSRKWAFYITLSLVWSFIAFTGFQISSIRAGIMGSIFLFAGMVNRPNFSVNSLILAGLIMLVVNPFLLKESVGFQLSFMATLGIILFLPNVKRFLERWKLFRSFGLSYLVGTTIAAQILILPLLCFYFGHFSSISPITNALIVPLLPYIMVMGVLFLLFYPVSLVLYFPIYILLIYMSWVIDSFSGFYVSFSFSWVWLPIYYLLVFGAYFYFSRRKREKIR